MRQIIGYINYWICKSIQPHFEIKVSKKTGYNTRSDTLVFLIREFRLNLLEQFGKKLK